MIRGRALDTAPPALYTLLEIRKNCPEILDKCEVRLVFMSHSPYPSSDPANPPVFRGMIASLTYFPLPRPATAFGVSSDTDSVLTSRYTSTEELDVVQTSLKPFA